MKLCSMFLVFLFSSCHTLTFQTEKAEMLKSKPDYAKSYSFFFSGLFPNNKMIYINEICKSGKADQIITETSFGNGILEIVTFGIYAPRVVKIWCKE